MASRSNLKELLQPGGTAVPPNYLDRLADAVVSLEYYMETLQAGRTDPWYMLDNAQTCLQALSQMPKRVVPTVPPLGPEAYAATVLLADAGATARAHALQAGVIRPPSRASPHAASVRRSRPSAPRPINIDPELLTLYIEEAREEVARIAKLFPAWEQNPLETDALAGVRRAFHTLKGSGRMVGATDISEFAWSIENLLNKIIENTLQRSPAILATMRDASAIAGELVNALEAGKARRRKCRTSSIARMRWPPTGRSRARRPPPWKFSSARSKRAATTSVAATGRVPTLQAAAGSRAAARDPASATPAEGRCEVVEGWASSEAGSRGEEIVLSAPEEEPSADMQLRDIYSRETAGEHRRGRCASSTPSARAARRTSSAKKPIAPATRFRAARAWPKRATASASRRRSNTGCASHSTAASASKRRSWICSPTA